MATDKNRVAHQGRLDFVSERLAEVTVARIGTHGCAMAKQAYAAASTYREEDKPNILVSPVDGA